MPQGFREFYCIRIPPAVPVVLKSFRYAKSHHSGKPPSDEGGGFAVGEDGGRETRSEKSLPQSFASQNPAPSDEGAFRWRITIGSASKWPEGGLCIPPARPVVMICLKDHGGSKGKWILHIPTAYDRIKWIMYYYALVRENGEFSPWRAKNEWFCRFTYPYSSRCG